MNTSAQRWFRICCCFLACLCGWNLAQADDLKGLDVVLDLNTSHQEIEGFGTSGGWWGPRVGAWPQGRRDRVLTLLYDRQRGAGLTIHRYHIGAGGNEELMADWRRVPTIETAPGKYDSRLDPGVLIAKQALAAGAKQVHAFACSPPGRLTRSGKVVANAGQTESNLAPERYAEYSSYLCDIVLLLRKQGLPISQFSPANEPQWAWDNNLGEGLHFEPDELVRFLRVFVAQAQQRIPGVAIEAFDSGSWGETAKYLGPIRDDPVLQQHIDSYSIHSYWSKDDDRRAFMKWAQTHPLDKPVHMTEWCQMMHGRSPGMESGCALASTVISDLTICNVRSWCAWLGVSPFDYRDALITADQTGTKIETNKRLWALANFSRFIRPGWVRIGAKATEDLPLVAARSPSGKRVCCVLVNATNKARQVSLAEKSGGRIKIQEAWLTSADCDLEKQPKVDATGQVTLPPASVVSILIAVNSPEGQTGKQ